jgi:hypothetical protein
VALAENLEVLNTELHRDLRMHASDGAHPHCVQVIVNEVNQAATCCPLFFVKDPETGRFNLVALFGFRPGELLVEGADRGSPLYVPLEMVRQGFYAVGDTIAIDRSHARFATGGTIALFDPMGEPTDETRLIQRTIGHLVAGRRATLAFVDDMVRLRMIEEINITLNFDDGEALTLEGLYTISLDALNELDDADVVRLFRAGHLGAALAIQGSSRQIGVLARRRNNAIAGL